MRQVPITLVAIAALPALVVELISGQLDTDLAAEVPLETAEEALPTEPFLRSEEMGTLSNVTCPECQGNLWEIRDGAGVRFRCRVGHAYSEGSIDTAQSQSVERALWSALKALEERVALMRKLAAGARHRGHNAVAQIFEERSRVVDNDVRAIHNLIVTSETLEPVGQDNV
jgi:two-component system chemotaxis response regulator CheB